MNIGKICIRHVVTARKDCSIPEATRLMREHHVGSLIIVSGNSDGEIPIGILTDRDIIVEVLAEDVPLDSVTVEDVMTRTPVVAEEEDDIFTTMENMRNKGVRRLPVTDSLGALVGIITIDDLLRIIYEEMGYLVSLISREQSEEIRKRTG